MLEFKDRTSSGLFYSLRGNVTFARSKVLENDKADPLYSNLSEIGHPIGQPFGLVAAGFLNQKKILTIGMTSLYWVDVQYREM